MANLTIAIDDEVLRKARIKALEQGTSVNALLREVLNEFVAASSAQERAARAFLEHASKSRARSGGRTWSRDELHER